MSQIKEVEHGTIEVKFGEYLLDNLEDVDFVSIEEKGLAIFDYWEGKIYWFQSHATPLGYIVSFLNDSTAALYLERVQKHFILPLEGR